MNRPNDVQFVQLCMLYINQAWSCTVLISC